MVPFEAEALEAGESELWAEVYYTDAFGQEHVYVTPRVPVTVAYPESISDLSPDRYFYPNGNGQDETAQVSYDLSTAGSVSVAIRDSAGRVVATSVQEQAEQAGGNSFNWDGALAGGAPAPEGVYTYTITVQGIDGPAATATGRIGLRATRHLHRNPHRRRRRRE